MIPSDRLTEFKRLLLLVDWNYQYAEGEAYWRGEATYRRADAARAALIREFPADVDAINEIWKARGRDAEQ